MTSLRFSICVSVCVHGVLFGAVAFYGLARHRAQLREGRREHIITVSLVAAPDEPVTEPASPAAKAPAMVPAPVTAVAPAVIPAPVPLPLPRPEPTVIVEAKPAPPAPPKVEPKPALPSPAAPTALTNAPLPRLNAVAITTAPVTNTAVAVPAALTGPAAPPSQNRVRGDGSSPQPGEDATTVQAPLGLRARPDYHHNPEPAYPLAARRRRQEGVVLLSVKVSAQGRAARVELKQTSGIPLLDDAAMQAVRGWEFQPARVGVTPVESEIEVPVRFKLQP